MGNIENQQKKQLQIQIDHPRISKSKIVIQDKQSKLVSNIGIDQKQYQKWSKRLQLLNSKYQHLLIPISHKFSRNGFCGQTGSLILEYENYSYLLAQQIQCRKRKKQRFSEQQLWRLLFNLSQAYVEAQKQKIYLGDIRPSNIFLNEEGLIKVTNQLSWPLEHTNIQKTMDRQNTYISPQDLVRVKNGQYFQGQQNISSAFSIGLTVLETINLVNYQHLYNLKELLFYQQGLKEGIINICKDIYYSQVLRGTIMSLCNIDMKQRLTCKELYTFLSKHEQKILGRTSFLIDNAPNKLHAKVSQIRSINASFKPFIPQFIQSYRPNLLYNPFQQKGIVQIQKNNQVKIQQKQQILIQKVQISPQKPQAEAKPVQNH